MARTLTLKYAGTCAGCGADLDAGTEAIWHRRGVVTCLGCKPAPLTVEAYQARKDAKVERYSSYADNARARSDAAYETTRQISDMIPLGQPILVGHHSEGRHRRDVARIESNMRKSVAESRKAEYWERRAASAANNDAIMSDDPDAADKLRAKIADLESQRDWCKRTNAALRKAGCKKGVRPTPEQLAQVDLTDRQREALLTIDYYSWSQPGFDTAHLSANIRRYKARLDALERDCES